MQRVNKITATFSGDKVIITLYKTNTKLGSITNEDMQIPNIQDTKITNKNAYMEYCKDVAKNLLMNGGIPGLYYEENPDEPTCQSSSPKKFDKPTFLNISTQMVTDMLTQMGIDYTLVDKSDGIGYVTITEAYKDQYIKYGSTLISVDIGGHTIDIVVEIRSGQLCKPKIFKHNNIELSFNATNIRKVTKCNE